MPVSARRRQQNRDHQQAHRDRERQRKERAEMDAENELIKGMIEAVGYGRLRFSLESVDEPDLADPFRVLIYFPDDAARLAVFRYAESVGLDVDTLIDRVLTQGMRNFTGNDALVLVE